MQIAWKDWVGQQLNTLVAVAVMGLIGVIALVTRPDDVTVTMACVTGIAGLAGNIQRQPQRATDTPPTNGSVTTTVTSHSDGGDDK